MHVATYQKSRDERMQGAGPGEGGRDRMRSIFSGKGMAGMTRESAKCEENSSLSRRGASTLDSRNLSLRSFQRERGRDGGGRR